MYKSEKKNETRKKIIDKLNDSFLEENKIIFKKYKPLKNIGYGTFSKIYSTIRLEDKSVFAMKTEKRNTPRKMLETEAYFLILLQGFGIPKLITFGHNKNYNILIETLLGKSLHDIFIKSKKPCDLKNICLIAIQLIERLEFIHSKNIVYRDVKPENFMIGIKDPNVIYIVDFGICKKYRSSKTGKHLLPRDTKIFNGTLKYSSANVIKGKESSRRDDLISLGYVLIFLYKRNLPWPSNFKNLNRATYSELIKSKETNANGEIFKNIPEELAEFVKYSEKLKFEEDPDYNYIKGFFQKILNRLNYNINKINFCWINPYDKNNKSLSRRKSSRRKRILENLDNIRIQRLQNNTINGINNLENKCNKDKTIIEKGNRFFSQDFENLTFNLNNNKTNILIENYNSNNGYNVSQTENNNKSNYINNEKNIEPKYHIKKLHFKTKKIKDLFKVNIPLTNIKKKKIQMNININPYKNIYITNNQNNFFNFENPRNKIANNILIKINL